MHDLRHDPPERQNLLATHDSLGTVCFARLIEHMSPPIDPSSTFKAYSFLRFEEHALQDLGYIDLRMLPQPLDYDLAPDPPPRDAVRFLWGTRTRDAFLLVWATHTGQAVGPHRSYRDGCGAMALECDRLDARHRVRVWRGPSSHDVPPGETVHRTLPQTQPCSRIRAGHRVQTGYQAGD